MLGAHERDRSHCKQEAKELYTTACSLETLSLEASINPFISPAVGTISEHSITSIVVNHSGIKLPSLEPSGDTLTIPTTIVTQGIQE